MTAPTAVQQFPSVRPPVVDSQSLRALAEAVLGQEGAQTRVVYDRTKERLAIDVSGPAAPGTVEPRPPMFVTKGDVTADHRPPFHVRLVVPETGKDQDLSQFHRYDALWWSLSAVEKFVLPYYVRLVSLEKLHEMWQNAKNGFADGTIIAVAHTPDSEYEAQGDGKALRALVTSDRFRTESGELFMDVPLAEVSAWR